MRVAAPVVRPAAGAAGRPGAGRPGRLSPGLLPTGPSAAVPEACWVRAIVFAVGGLVDVAEVVDGRQGQDFVHLGKDIGHTVAHVWDSIF
jgi:hypothetical protein